MPSALETLVKILKLERDQGCKNTAVIGGMSAYAKNWESQARGQARNPEQRALVEELNTLLNRYEGVENKTERNSLVNYMLDRIVGRIPMPPEYRNRLAEFEVKLPQTEASPAATVERDERTPRDAASPALPDDASQPQPPRDKPRDKRNKQKDRQERQERPERQGRAPQPQPPQAAAGESASNPADTPSAMPHGAPSAQPFTAQGNIQGSVSDQQPQPKQKPPRPPKDKPRQQQPSQQQHNPPKGGQKGGGRGDAHARGGGDGEAVAEVVFEPGDSIEATYTGQLDIPAEPRLARAPRKPRKAMEADEAADVMRGLNAPVTTVRGIGPRMAQSLKKLGIETLNDLLFFLPRRYDDYTKLRRINKLLPGLEKVTVIGTVRKAEIYIGRNSRKDFYMEVDDGSAELSVIFFGQQFLIRTLRPGMQVVLSGNTSTFNGRIRMMNPEWEKLDAENLHTVGIVPVYPLTEGLSARMLRRQMKEAVEYWADKLPDYVPEATLERAELADFGWTIKNLHFPEGHDHLEHARNRFVFDQLLLMQMAILANRRDWQAVPGQPLTITDEFIESFIDTVFPYPLTGAQRRAIEDIRRDVSGSIPMNRLIQGDVGAGKTAVAITAMAMAFANGKQAALMAPTGILAEQHYRGISRVFEKMPGERKPIIKLLTGSISNSERDSVYEGLAQGWVDIVIGTHAVIQEGVQFNDLAVAVIDEQHRFGVEQRGALRGKGTNPHILVMTATPIPRTLALTMYADLDLTVIDEMPPGRIPIRTRIVREVERERIYNFIEAQIKEGRQAFIVHPLVEASEKVEAKSAVEAYEYLQQKAFHRYRVGLLHGKMKPQEKDQVMADFSAGQYDILVTTSVAEVGVDVPNASIIVIEGANRFGLAQLHQFRGRVGRGQHASYCLLIPDMETPEAQERLTALEQTTDGFQLAEIDWKLRGAGDLVGTRQSGQGELQLLEAMTPHLVGLAQREARTIYAEDPYLQQPEHRLLAQRVAQIYRSESDLS
jgi:ATP-dependent DNA helicase RecG